MMSLWDALRMNMMISYQELVRTFPRLRSISKQEVPTTERRFQKPLFVQRWRCCSNQGTIPQFGDLIS